MGCRRFGQWIAPLLFLVALGCEDVAIVVPKDAAAPIRFGASEVETALKAKKIAFRVTESAGKDVRVSIVLGVAGPGDEAVPKLPESYVIRKQAAAGGCEISAIGRDAAGAMYAAFDLAEQIRAVESAAGIAEAVEERCKSPYLRIRGVNSLILKDGLEKGDSYFHSLEYWRNYLDMLARCRFNLLDLHACYDVTTTDFSNIFPYLVRSDAFPGATPPGVDPARNLAMLNRIIEMAKARGINVGLMNCFSELTQVPRNRVGEYTRECVGKVLRACPDLRLFGFRIDESGREADFFREYYLPAIADVRKDIDLYTRTWLVPQSKVMDIAGRSGGRFFVEIKFNGEHLGLPYIVAGDRVSMWGGGSYQAYSDYPRDYEIIYQVMANGTHRIFHWGDPGFASRCVRSCTFADAAGVSIEPMTAHYPQTNYFINANELGKPFFTWAVERDWFWYMVWGRTAYDPDTPDRVWIDAFRRRFGEAAGDLIYRAVTLSSKVVPLIYSYHCLGADRRTMAPELETGDGHQRKRLEDGGVKTDWQGNILDFVNVPVLDDTAMTSVRGHVESQITGTPNGKFGPHDFARTLSEVSLAAAEQIEKAERAVSESRQEYRCIRMDVEALRRLASYYSEKTQAAVALEFYRRTMHLEFLDDALKRCLNAIAEWDALSQVTARHYRPLVEPLRMCTTRFTWAQEEAHLPQDIVMMKELQAEFVRSVQSIFRDDLRQFSEELGPQGPKTPEELKQKEEELGKLIASKPAKIGHCPVTRAPVGATVRIAATVGTVAPNVPAFLCCRRAGEKEFKRIAMLPRATQYVSAAFVPAEMLAPGKVEYYIEAGAEKGKAVWPEKGPDAPQVIHIVSDTTKPTIEPVPLDEHTRGGKVTIKAKISDESSIAKAALRYKVMPSYNQWQAAEMKKTGEHFEAEIPLTPEGLLYSFEATDEMGNAAIHPDFRERTPYYIIRSWEPAWVQHGVVSLPEGVETYQPAAGQYPFTDNDLRIEQISVELKGLLGIKLSERSGRTASLYNGGGCVVRFKLSSPARMVVGFGKREMRGWSIRQPGWVALDDMAVKLGKHTLDVCCRDFLPGEHAFAFTRGCGVILGFRELKPGEKPLEAPFLLVNGKKDFDVLKTDYLTIPGDMETYPPKFGAVMYTDRMCLIVTMPKELKGLLGVRFFDFAARRGDFEVAFKLSEPARLYVVFGKSGSPSWDEPHPDFTLYKKDAYKQSDGGLCDIYYKDFPAGQSGLVLKKGTAVILGFRKLGEIGKK